MEGQRKLKAARVLCVGTGGLGSPLALYLAAAGIGTLGLVDFDVVDASNLQRQIIHSTKDIGRKKLDSAAEKLTALNPALECRKARDDAHERQCAGNPERLRHRCRWHGQLPDALPGQRCLCAAGQAQCLWIDLPLRGAGQCLCHRRRPLLSLPLSRAATARTRAELRGRRRPGNSAWPGRRHPGYRGHQAHPWQRKSTDRAAASGRCARHALPRAEAAQESRVPGMRRESHGQGTDRLRAFLRHRARIERGENCEEWRFRS